MSAAPDLLTRIADLERERNEARATVARIEALADDMESEFHDFKLDQPLHLRIRKAIQTPAVDELCDCRGDASRICPPCRHRRYQ